MTTLIQPTSNVNSANAVTPLYVVRHVSQDGSVTSTAVATASSITTLGASNPTDSVTYDAISLLQSFSPTFSLTGLTSAQQKQLALALGLSANATSSDLTNAINKLLTPANPADELVNVLVGSTTTETTTSTIPSFLNTNGEIAGVPLSSTSQATNNVLATLSELGATTTASNAVNATGMTNVSNTNVISPQATTGNPSTTSANQNTNIASATTGTATNLTNAASYNTQSAAANVSALNTIQVQENLPAANLTGATNENLASATPQIPETATSVFNAATLPETLPTGSSTQAPPVAALASNITTVESAANTATANMLGTTSANTNVVAANTAENNTSTSTTYATTTTASASTITTSSLVNASENLVAENIIASEGNLSTAGVTAAGLSTTSGMSTTTVAQPVTPTVIQGSNLPTVNSMSITGNAAIGGIVSGNLTPTTPLAEATASAVNAANTASLAFENAESVLQSLLVDAASHALIATNQAAATYSVPGAVYQLSSGIDHAQQTEVTEQQTDVPAEPNPVARVNPVKGTLNKQK